VQSQFLKPEAEDVWMSTPGHDNEGPVNTVVQVTVPVDDSNMEWIPDQVY